MSLPEPLLLGYHLYTEPIPGVGGRAGFGVQGLGPAPGEPSLLRTRPLRTMEPRAGQVWARRWAPRPGRDMG